MFARFARQAQQASSRVSQNAKNGIAIGSGAVAGFGVTTALANDEVVHPAQYPWSHNDPWAAFDMRSVKRGHEVYTQLCASCHGLSRIAYRNFVGTIYTEAEAKALAEESEFEDGPNDEGEMFMRPGKLSDYLPSPFPNEEAARAANGGAYPPDLSLIVKARHDGANYVFALLTGYKDAPEGIELREGLAYNPYFPGHAIGMPQQLFDGALDYEDGTPSTASQMAKDVVTFLHWAAEPEADERKLMGIKFMLAMAVAAGAAGYFKRWKWSLLKSRTVTWKQ